MDAQSVISILRGSTVFLSESQISPEGALPSRALHRSYTSSVTLMHVMHPVYELTCVPKLYSESTPHALLLFCFISDCWLTNVCWLDTRARIRFLCSLCMNIIDSYSIRGEAISHIGRVLFSILNPPCDTALIILHAFFVAQLQTFVPSCVHPTICPH